LHASLTEKVATIRQKIKNSIKKVTLNDVLDYTAKAAIVVIGVALIVECRHRKEQFKLIRDALNEGATRIESLINPFLKRMASFENEVSTIRGNLIGQEKIAQFIAEARECLAYPHTEVQEKDGRIITQTFMPIQRQLDKIWKDINQIKTSLENPKAERKSQKETPNPEKKIKKRGKEKK